MATWGKNIIFGKNTAFAHQGIYQGMRLSTPIHRLLPAIVTVALVIVSCAEDPVAVVTIPEVKSIAVKDITSHSADIVAYLETLWGVSCTLKAGTEPPIELPGIPDDKGVVEWTLNNLSPSTQYSIAIELSSNGRSIVSEPVTFETRAKSPPAGEWVQFRDAIFEQCCLDEFDYDGNGYITKDEAQKISTLHVSERGITSLEGIEHFTNLKSLYCNGNDITSLKEIKALPLLTTLNCADNLLDVLDLSHNADTMETVYCTPQKKGEISTLIIHSEQVIHGITDIRSSTFIHPGTSIIEAVRFKDKVFEEYCLKAFDLNGDEALTTDEAEKVNGIFIDDMGISSIDEIRYFHNLEILSARGNMLSGSLDLSANKKLIALLVGGNHLSAIDLSSAKGLTSVDIEGCQVNSHMFNEDLKVLNELTSLNCGHCGLESLNLSHQRALSSIDCEGNRLKVIDLRYNANDITHFCCTPQESGEVEELYVKIGQTVKGVTERRSTDSVSTETEVIEAVLFESPAFEEYCLQRFDTDRNGYLTSEETKKIREIIIQELVLGSLKGIECFPNLVTLICEECGLSGELDLSRNTKLKTIGLSRNELTGLVLGYHPELNLLNLHDNRISSINLSGTPGLTSLSVEYCPLGNALNDELKKVPLLYDLRCSNCNLTELDLSGLLYVRYFTCQNNRLTTLDLSYAADTVIVGSCRQRTTKEIGTIYVRKGQTIIGLTGTLDEDCFSPTTQVVVKE